MRSAGAPVGRPVVLVLGRVPDPRATGLPPGLSLRLRPIAPGRLGSVAAVIDSRGVGRTINIPAIIADIIEVPRIEKREVKQAVVEQQFVREQPVAAEAAVAESMVSKAAIAKAATAEAAGAGVCAAEAAAVETAAAVKAAAAAMG